LCLSVLPKDERGLSFRGERRAEYPYQQ